MLQFLVRFIQRKSDLCTHCVRNLILWAVAASDQVLYKVDQVRSPSRHIVQAQILAPAHSLDELFGALIHGESSIHRL